MGLVDTFILLGLFLVGVPLAGALGWLLRTVFRTNRLSGLPVLIVLVTIVAGAPLALRVAGVPTDARVVSRDELIRTNRDGSWMSIRTLHVRFRPTDATRADPTSREVNTDSVNVGVRAGEDEFDHAAVGALVPVTYVALRPSIAKLADRTIGDFWGEVLAIGGIREGGSALLALACIVFVWRWSPQAAALRALRGGALVVTVGAFVAVATYSALHSPAHGSDEPTPAAASARVEAVSTISSLATHRQGRLASEQLVQPYEVVTLAFTPYGARFPVRTADAIDSGSVRGMVMGAMIPVHYAPDHPRAARIDGAMRTFETRNGRDRIEWAAVCVGGLVVLWLFAAWRRSRHRMAR